MKVFAITICTGLAMVTLLPAKTGAAAPPPQRIQITARRFEFVPSDVTVKKGEPVTLALSSQDVDHGVKFKELNVSVMVKKGQTREVTFTLCRLGPLLANAQSSAAPAMEA